jgi:hypothetical protein
LKVALTLAPGATGSGNVFDVVVPETTEVHCLLGKRNAQLDARRRRTRGIRESHGGVLRRFRGKCLQSWRSRKLPTPARGSAACTPYLAATTFACTKLVGGVGRKAACRRHCAFIECALRTIAVVAAVAQQDCPLLAHGVVTWQLIRGPSNMTARLPLCASPPMEVQWCGSPLAICGHESPGDARQVLHRVCFRPD